MCCSYIGVKSDVRHVPHFPHLWCLYEVVVAVWWWWRESESVCTKLTSKWWLLSQHCRLETETHQLQ